MSEILVFYDVLFNIRIGLCAKINTYVKAIRLLKETFFPNLGPDWEWDDQDGGAGNIGFVVAVVGDGVVLVIILI